MNTVASKVPGWRGVLGWRRVRATAITCTVLAALFSISWMARLYELWLQVFGIGFCLLLVFGLFERWPRQLPRWMARWALQVVAVGVSVPVWVFTAYTLRALPSGAYFWASSDRLEGFIMFTVLGTLLAPWIALSALVRQREAWAQE